MDSLEELQRQFDSGKIDEHEYNERRESILANFFGSTTKPDFYTILQLSRSANESEIKTNYRKLALKHHPDKNGGIETEEVIPNMYIYIYIIYFTHINLISFTSGLKSQKHTEFSRIKTAVIFTITMEH